MAAARRVLHDVRPADALPGVRAVCREAGISTGRFYAEFGSLEAYHRDLVDALLARAAADEARTVQELTESSTAVDRTSVELRALIGSINGALAREGQAGDRADALRIRSLLWSIAGPPGADPEEGDTRRDVRDRCRIDARRRAEAFGEAIEQAHRAFRLRVRAPFHSLALADLVLALADGLALRTMAGPAAASTTLLEDALRAVAFVIVVPDDGPADSLDELVGRGTPR